MGKPLTPARKSKTSNPSNPAHVTSALPTIQVQEQYQERYSGILPPPDMLKHFDEIIPGAAERILVMAENQAKHRQKIETTIVSSGTRDSLIGLIFGFLLGIATIIGGVIIALNVHATAGTFMGITGMACLAGVFVYGTRANFRKQQKDKPSDRKKEQ